VRTGSLLFVTGQLSRGTENAASSGNSVEFDVEGQRAAALRLNVIAQLRAALDGDLDRVVRCVRIGGFVNSMPDSPDSRRFNGASDTFVDVFGTRDTLLERPWWRRCPMTSQWKSKDF
jgi:enamine deaminase RidA (YjgF/YER057c/UK114 family)